MATQLFKDGESIFVPTNKIKSHMDLGWSPDDPDAPAVARMEVSYPEHIKPEEMDESDLQDEILKEMNIKVKHPKPAKKRGRPRKKAA